ncbi:MAG: efflux RND transporter periplasmic adaptor subunit [Burkholderiales bacterium]|nr:efflux RND transporter periplasmic adaptor subunit [Burkholderiales bacterium]
MRKPIVVLASLCALAAAAAARAAHEIPFSPDQIQRLGITLVKVAPASTLMTDRVPARVVIPPEQEHVVSSPEAGLVKSLRVAIGDQVHAGQPLAVVESPELVGLQRDFLQASAELRLAHADLARDEQLFKEGIIPERRLLTTRSRFEQAQASLEERRQALRLVGLDASGIKALEGSRALSSALVVRAPVSGAVLRQMAVVGQRVDKSAPLYRIGKLEPLWLEIRVPLDRLGSLAPGAEVGLPCPAATAAVTLVGRSVDPETQTVLLRAEVHGGTECIRPGQYLQVRVALLGAEKQWRVPSGALARSGDATMVFVRSAEGFRPLEIEVQGEDAGFSVVRADLRGDELVAASGIAAIKAVWLGQGGNK